MNRIAAASAALLASTALAQADISRTDQSMRLMFENVGPSGNYAELSFGTVRPKAGATGFDENPLVDYHMPGFGFVHRYSDNLSVGLIYDTPYGAAVRYAPAPGIFNGGGANVETDALTLIGRYSFSENVSAHFGVRALRGEGTINTFFSNPAFDPTQAPSLINPPAFPANLTASSDTGYGFLIGGAYEVPEIALRVALTYHSPISLAFSATEQSIGAPSSRPFETEFPESYNLEFQSGVAADTLVFGSVRYQMWDGFNLTVPNSVVPGQTNARYVNFTSDSTTYNLGVGRRINENWSASVSYTHRTPGTTPSDTALAPTTGLNSLALAGQYTKDAMTVSGGFTYGIPGDQIVENQQAAGGEVNFNDNSVIGLGLRIGFRF